MADNTSNQSLDDRYQQAIDDHRSILLQLQEEFNQHCDQITKYTKHTLAEVPDQNTEKRHHIFQEQKRQLDQALAKLKHSIETQNKKTRNTLEEIHRQREASKLNKLEQLMAEL